MTLRLKSLSLREQTELTRLLKSRATSQRLVERARIIWNAHLGSPTSEIAEALEVSENTVRLWIKRFNADGMKGLDDRQRRGRPGLYTPAELEAVLKAARTPPGELGLNFSVWTLDRLEGYLNDELGIAMKRSRIGELLSAHGISWSAARG